MREKNLSRTAAENFGRACAEHAWTTRELIDGKIHVNRTPCRADFAALATHGLHEHSNRFVAAYVARMCRFFNEPTDH